MNQIRRLILIFGLLTLFSLNVLSQNEKLFLGIRLRPEVRKIADDVELKTKKKIVAVFDEFENEFTLGSSFIGDDGIAYLRVNSNLERQKQKLEAVVTHELLHLRLRANNYPVFLFSPKVKTLRGLAQDVEQPNVNDLTSFIEHRIFKAEMNKLGLNQLIDLAGDTERAAKQRFGEQDSQVDTINFVRAVLEYQNPADVQRLRQIYVKNKWQISLKKGQEIADLIDKSRLDSPESVAAVFKLCLAKLYLTPRPAKLTLDKSIKTYRQYIISY